MEQVKIVFESEEGVENLWATPVADGFVLDNYPFYLKGVNFGDLVAARSLAPGCYAYERTLAKSPHSCYRVFYERMQLARAEALLASLRAIGCAFERSPMEKHELVALHIPDTVSADAAWAILETGLDEGTWQVQEGEDRHPCLQEGQD
ncbi:DUF4265 domain-containing protein [Massilia sp. Dwa41.01b]|uniref:DUF4265 domain-containing protein n=1 Tax=unclassified Massilia TaxID=2609279 RepID=UPI0015FFD5CC|nr:MULTISPECIES: DUF4265 domain-containing protein [unclassified Massilia]QNA90553.1 DUF4265 domain-containing protein [Massilia sp. Dwa41.01b]QNA97784.1 DUF4265 domain-containing protein [Massilia sp. Se16.2.3]